MKRLISWLCCQLRVLVEMPRKVLRNNPLWQLLAKNWQFSQGRRRTIVCFWLMFLLAESIDLLLVPLVNAWIMSSVQGNGVTNANIWSLYWLLALLFACTPLFWLLHGPARVMERHNAFLARLDYRRFLLQGVMTMPMGWHTSHHSGDTIDKVEKGVNALYGFSEDSFEVIYAIFRFVGCYSVLAFWNWRYALIAFLMLLVTIWVVTRVDKVLIPQYKELSLAENRVAESVFDAISNIATVVTLRVEALVFKGIMHKAEEPYGLFQHNNRLNELKWFLCSLCCRFTTVTILGLYFWQQKKVVGSGLVVAGLYLMLNYLGKVSDVFQRFTWLYGEVVQRRAKVANAELLSQDFVGGSFANHVLPSGWQRLEVQDLIFTYDASAGEPQLDGVSFELMRGKRYAFVGKTGSGKTTLLKVIRDLCRPTHLRLLVDGVEVQDGFAGISRAIALIPQSPEVFATTVLENITLGAEYDLEVVMRYVRMACFEDVLKLLPRGLFSETEEKGVNLSGGQQQRLALARGLLACEGKDIICLDEPTASLDAVTEADVYRKIFEGFAGRTIVSTIHRLHLLPCFDQILFFDQGKLVASGTLPQLLESCSHFREMWAKQVMADEAL